MKNLLSLLAAAVAGYALARTIKPTPLIVEVSGTLRASGADLETALRTHQYRNMRAH